MKKKNKQKKLFVTKDECGQIRINWTEKERIAEVEKNVGPTITLAEFRKLVG